jgi:hypothetical protein
MPQRGSFRDCKSQNEQSKSTVELPLELEPTIVSVLPQHCERSRNATGDLDH